MSGLVGESRMLVFPDDDLLFGSGAPVFWWLPALLSDQQIEVYNGGNS
jgi:hypothetical protein